jgi:hypothetical protein
MKITRCISLSPGRVLPSGARIAGEGRALFESVQA